jgi:ribosomal protein S6--L-glutamate ligase
MALIRQASRIYYPSSLYADVFAAMGKSIFPSHATYLYAQDKIKQTALFKVLDIPHPATRVFYGRRQKATIDHYFKMPFIAKVPRGSALGQGVFFIDSQEALAHYCEQHPAAYIQEYLPITRDMRIVIIGGQVVHAYWRIAPDGEFRTNVGIGGTIDFTPVPREARDLALHTARACGWDDVGMDVCIFEEHYYILEANMKYGREGFRLAGLDYTSLMEHLIRNGQI